MESHHQLMSQLLIDGVNYDALVANWPAPKMIERVGRILDSVLQPACDGIGIREKRAVGAGASASDGIPVVYPPHDERSWRRFRSSRSRCTQPAGSWRGMRAGPARALEIHSGKAELAAIIRSDANRGRPEPDTHRRPIGFRAFTTP